MRRRLTLVMVALVAAALAVAGAGALVLAGLDERRKTEAELAESAEDLAGFVTFAGTQAPGTLPAVRRSLQLDGVALARLSAVGPSTLPAGVSLDTAQLADLRIGVTVSQIDGNLVSAAARVRSGRQQPPGDPSIIVVAREVPLIPEQVGRWFVTSSLVTLLVAALTGLLVARRLLVRLRRVESTTTRIAGGDLTARVDDDGRDEVAVLGRAVNTMAEALERGRGVERNFLLSVSHDLRTPLTSIRGYAEAIADGAVDDPRRAATVVLDESRRLERLVADLLELAKLDARHFSLRPQEVDVAAEVRRTAEGFRPACDEARVALEVVAPGPVLATVDVDRLGQVVANLVENGLRHARSRVEVRVDADDGAVVVRVVDDGAGIDAEDLPHVFDRLFVGRSPARSGPGTGLGLAIVAELVAALGGTVIAEAGHGTTMTVRLPSAQPTAPSASWRPTTTAERSG